MRLNEFIAHLQALRAQHGDIPVWVKDGIPPSPRVTVQEMFSPDPKEPPEKVVLVE